MPGKELEAREAKEIIEPSQILDYSIIVLEKLYLNHLKSVSSFEK